MINPANPENYRDPNYRPVYLQTPEEFRHLRRDNTGMIIPKGNETGDQLFAIACFNGNQAVENSGIPSVPENQYHPNNRARATVFLGYCGNLALEATVKKVKETCTII